MGIGSPPSPELVSPWLNASTFWANRPFSYAFGSRVFVPTNVAMATAAMHDSKIILFFINKLYIS